MPLETLITGRIATLSGTKGFGWVEAIGIRAGRIAFAGSEVDLETRADPFTQRIRLEPDQVAFPGLTDAHLHLAQAAIAASQVDLTTAATLGEGLERLAAAHARLPPDAWLEGHGWDSDRWGAWPTADQLETVAPGRRASIWAHDHHALWASHAALTAGGLDADRRRSARWRRPAQLRRPARGRPARVRDPPRDRPRPAADQRRPGAGHHRGRTGARVARGRRLPRPGGGRARPRPHVLVPGLRPVVRHGATAPARARLHARRRDPDGDRTRSAQRAAAGHATGRPSDRRLAEVLRRRVARFTHGRAPGRHRARARPTASRPTSVAASG